MPKLNDDQTLTQAIVNLVTSGYQGMYAFCNVLEQFNHPAYKPESREHIEKALDAFARWNDELYKGAEVFSASWDTPKTFEAQDCIRYANELGIDLVNTANFLRSILTPGQAPTSIEDVGFLIACFNRVVYTKENYVRGLMELARYQESDPQVLSNGEVALKQIDEEIKRGHLYINKVVNAENLNKSFLAEINVVAYNILPEMYVIVHEINQLTARFKGGLTSDNLGFTNDEMKIWSESRIPPVAAGYWRAFLFGPQESVNWLAAGIPNPGAAYQWRMHGFTSEDATPWIREGFTPTVARTWRDANQEASVAAEFIKQGVTDPKKIPR